MYDPAMHDEAPLESLSALERAVLRRPDLIAEIEKGLAQIKRGEATPRIW